MHGRLKVRTSAEEAARKQKEQEQKVKLYYGAMKKIREKRESGDFDKEMMDLIGKILASNPDVYTLWNIRKECILKLTETEKDQDIFDRDLSFTEVCLQSNPKSYGAWHHRCWILQNSPGPNWTREVELCTKYLKMDERNFHCWDYRRFAVKNAIVPPESEFKFCTEKIEKNFSNYSSWHYRSQLLPILHPHENDKTRPISEEKLKEELELVLTAAFTDPNDSSAWFYQRWLLGYSAPELDFATFHLTKTHATVTFTKPINLCKDFHLTSNFSSDFQFMDWKPVNTELAEDHTWVLRHDFAELDKGQEYVVTLGNKDSQQEYHIALKSSSYAWIGFKVPRFEYEFGAVVIDELKIQLESCNQLLEYEPDSKWTLLTASLLMRAIDRTKNHTKTIENLEKLQVVDELRRGYYQDLASKWHIQNKLEESLNAGEFNPSLDLSNLKLTSIFYENYMSIFSEINLNNNLLSNRNLDKMKYFQNVNCLQLEENKITSIETFPKLRFLGSLSVDQIQLDHGDIFAKCQNISYMREGGAILNRCFFKPNYDY